MSMLRSKKEGSEMLRNIFRVWAHKRKRTGGTIVMKTKTRELLTWLVSSLHILSPLSKYRNHGISFYSIIPGQKIQLLDYKD
jgi:hypothetical protein